MLHNRAGELFAVEPDGSVVAEIGETTDYRIILSGDDAAGTRAGDVSGRLQAGSIYLAHEHAPEDCLFHRGSHLLMLTLPTATAPPGPSRSDITAHQGRLDVPLGTGPGNAIQLTAPEHRRTPHLSTTATRPATAYLSCAAIYSGTTVDHLDPGRLTQ